MKYKRTFGWIENSGDLGGLKKVAGIFVKGSDVHRNLIKEKLPLLFKNKMISKEDYDKFISVLRKDKSPLPYTILKGRGCGSGSRSQAKCTGLVQAVLEAQKNVLVVTKKGKQTIKKPYTDDWTAECFLRWAVSTGILEYNEKEDTCQITELGRALLQASTEKEEREVQKKALMHYPPVQRILQILKEEKDCTKFDIGSKLGFVGEKGFTSIPLGYFMALITDSPETERGKIRNNVEGDSDKYARMITGWLCKVGWAKMEKKEKIATYGDKAYQRILSVYNITPMGEKALKDARGNSSKSRMEKIVPFQMLATKVPDVEYIRTRRAHIIQCLKKPKTIDDIQEYLKKQNFSENKETIENDIRGLENMGLFIEYNRLEKYEMKEKIVGLQIPTKKVSKADITALKDKILARLKELDHKYLILVDLAYSDADKQQKSVDAREFEIKTAELFTQELSFKGERLGDAERPDVVIWKKEKGIIIDNKSYKNGFSINRSNEDEMSRYIDQAKQQAPKQPKNEWWKIFKDNAVTNLYFLFVTSVLKNDFKKYLDSLFVRQAINGGAIDVENLLYMAEKIRRGNMEEENVFELMSNNEIKIDPEKLDIPWC